MSQALSAVGTRASSIAYPLLVLGFSGSPAMAGVVASMQTFPLLLWYLPAGNLADRGDLRRIMLVADGVRALALASVAVALGIGHLTLPHIVAAAVTEGTMVAFFQVAEFAILPQVVNNEHLSTAVAQNQAREEGAELAGRPLGGFLFGLGQAMPFIADAVSYSLSFVLILFIRPRPRAQTSSVPSRGIEGVREGAGWLFRQPFLRSVTLLIGGTNLVFNALMLVMIVRATELGARPWQVGAMFGSFGVGAILGSLVAPFIQRRLAAQSIVIGSLWLWAFIVALMALSPNIVVLGALGGATMVTTPPLNVVTAVYRYALTPEHLRARVQAVTRLVGNGSLPVGSLAAGFLTARIGATSSLAVLGIALVALAGVASCAVSVRNPPALNATT